jgi:hypothetical protein
MSVVVSERAWDLRLIDSGGGTFLYTIEAGAIAGPSEDSWGKFK